MTYGSDAQPDIKAHMSHIEVWLRYYDKYNGDENKRQLMEAAWCKALARIDNVRKNGGKETGQMLSAMSATIVSLRLVDIEPVSIHGWTNNRKGEEGIQIRLGKDQNVGRQDLLEVLSKRFEERMWQHVIAGEATGGLEKGMPSFELTKKCQKWLGKVGRNDQAKCAESIAIHGIWNATRKHSDNTLQICSGCGKEPETPRHRYWECCENKNIKAEDVVQSQNYANKPKTNGKEAERVTGTEEHYRTTSEPSSLEELTNTKRKRGRKLILLTQLTKNA